MHKIKSFFKRTVDGYKKVEITTPAAIIIGSIIIAASIVAYGYIIRPSVLEVKDLLIKVAQQLNVPEATPDLVQEIADDLNLTGSKWEACLTSQNTKDQIQKELNDGVAAGVNGTPSTFILVNKNGTYEIADRIAGAQPEAVVRQAIDKVLAGDVKTTPFGGSPVTEDEFVQGTKSNVVVLEYADAECPYCVRFHPTINNIMKTYGNRIGFVYRHFPLTQIHPDALRYATAIECAGNVKGKDAYFSFIDKLFTKEAEGQ